MTCTNGCPTPAVAYVDHYRIVGAGSRVYPAGRAGTGLVCETCRTQHGAGYDAYEEWLQSGRQIAAAGGESGKPTVNTLKGPETSGEPLPATQPALTVAAVDVVPPSTTAAEPPLSIECKTVGDAASATAAAPPENAKPAHSLIETIAETVAAVFHRPQPPRS